MEEESQTQGSHDPDKMETKEPVIKKEHHEPKRMHHTHSKTGSMQQDTIHKVLIGAAVIQILLLIFVAFQVSSMGSLAAPGSNAGQRAPAAAAPSAPQPDTTPATVENLEVLIDNDPVLGEDSAGVTIIEWSDYECPFCGRFFSQTYPQIKSQYVEAGRAKLVFRDFPLSFHRMAEPAAIAANCAAKQDKFWEFHDLVFENQASLSESSLSSFATQLGLDMSAWQACRNDAQVRAEVAKDLNDGQKAGVAGTPGFLVLMDKDSANMDLLESLQQVDPRSGDYIIRLVETQDGEHVGVRIGGAHPFEVFQAAIEASG